VGQNIQNIEEYICKEQNEHFSQAPCDRQFPGPSAYRKLRLFGVDIDLPAGHSDMQQQETPQSQHEQQQVEAVQPFPLVRMSHRQPIVAPQSIVTTTNTEAGTAGAKCS
jgi:hypothetical protein